MVLIRKNDLAAYSCLSTSGFHALLLAAAAAAIFGDIALDKALEPGFDKAPLEEHELPGLTTLWIMIGLASWQLVARWRHLRLSGTTGWLFFAVALVASGILLTAAYHGGELGYRLCANVNPVHP